MPFKTLGKISALVSLVLSLGCSGPECEKNLENICYQGVGECERAGNYCPDVCDAVPGNPVEEICDNLDNDCDGVTDEGDTCPILFDSDMEGNHEIYMMNPDGSNLRQLTENEHWNRSPVSSPDRRRIAYISETQTRPRFEINVMNYDGSGVERIYRSSILINSLSWSPDGSKILYDLYDYEEDDWDIYEMGSDGSNPTPLINTPENDTQPEWSPDGTKIVFRSRRDGNSEIYIMDSDGSNQTRLTNNPTGDYFPAWSPDGTKIAFVSERDGNPEIYKMNVDGSNQTRLTYNDYDDGNPDWSPDGERIVFDTIFNGAGFGSWSDIFVMNADGTHSENITITQAYRNFNMHPHWSP